MGDGAGPQSVGVVLSYSDLGRYLCSVVQLDLLEEPQEIDAKYRAHFSTVAEVPPFRLMFSPPVSRNYDLFMLPYKPSIPDWPFYIEKTPLHCAAFNCSTSTSTKRFQSISPPNPNSATFNGVTVTVGQDIYYIAHPFFHPKFVDEQVAFFERYIPAKKSWEKLEPFPHYPKLNLRDRSFIEASAVWNDDTILLNVGFLEIWAYRVFERKWYKVHVDHNNLQCYDFIGGAFVVGNTIYALSSLQFDLVLALSIDEKKDGAGGDPEFSCSFRAVFIVPCSSFLHLGKDEKECCTSRSLVRLGEDLGFVATREFSAETQPVQLTYIKLKGEGKMVSTGEYLSWLELKADEHFHIEFCFSLPECKTTAIEPCETFIFNPYTGFTSKQEDESDFTLEPEVGKPIREEENVTQHKDDALFNVQATSVLAAKGNVASKEAVISDEEGRCVVLMNLSPDATANQLVKGLKEFGNVKRDTIQHIKNARDKSHFAVVEFESETSKKHAIEALPIRIGGRSVCILEKSGSPLPKVDIKGKRSSGSSRRNKNHKRKRAV